MVSKNSSSTPPAATEQKTPKGAGKEVIELVKKDLDSRVEVGKQRYGETLKSFNGRDALLDAYQEALDLTMYLRQTLDERDTISKMIKYQHEINEFPKIENVADAEHHISMSIGELYKKVHKGDRRGVSKLLAKLVLILAFLQVKYGEE